MPGVAGNFGLGSTEWSRAKANRVLPRECTGHSKHPLPTTQEKTVHVDITRWSYQNQIDYILCSQRWRTSQVSSVAQLCLTLCDPMNHSMPGLPVHHQCPESTQTHAHWVGDAIQPSHPLLSPSPPAPNPSQEKLYTVSKNKTESWVWLRSWNPYCQIQT